MYRIDADTLERMGHGTLIELVRRGRIVVMSDTNPKGPKPKLDDFAHFAGQRIHISAAAREFRIPHQTISGWARRGILTVVGQEKNRKLLDKQRVAYIVALYKWSGGRHGSRLFDTGRLIKPEEQEETS